MTGKRKRLQHKQLSKRLALDKVQTEHMKGRDKTMLQKKTEYQQEVNSK